MALETVFAALAERMGPEVSFGGPDESEFEDRPPRITWEPMESEFGPARRLSGGAGDDGALWTQQFRVKVELWGENLRATEDLVATMIATLHDLVTRHSYAPVKAAWNTGGVGDKGVLCTMLLAINTPVLRTPQETVAISVINATYSMNTED